LYAFITLDAYLIFAYLIIIPLQAHVPRSQTYVNFMNNIIQIRRSFSGSELHFEEQP
jgi:hypothetical protein